MKLTIRKSFLISNQIFPVQACFKPLSLILDFHHVGADGTAFHTGIFSGFINPKIGSHTSVFCFHFPSVFYAKCKQPNGSKVLVQWMSLFNLILFDILIF